MKNIVRSLVQGGLGLVLLVTTPLSGQQPTTPFETPGAPAPRPATPAEAAPDKGSTPGEAEVSPSATPATARPSSDRTTLNLLGQEDSSKGEAKRNENVSLTLIDNNVLKELNQRMGTTATVIAEFTADRNYFGTEYGGSPGSPLHLASSQGRGFKGELNWSHNNSIVNARSFFQVGGVRPSRANDYGFLFSTRIWKGGYLSMSGSQRKSRGQVNGNVLVPGANERVPTTTDPATRAFVLRILQAYPLQLPNRTDINPRALNTNAAQNIDNEQLSATLDQNLGKRDRLTLRHNFTLQNVDGFELVVGQNPNTTTRNHDARATWSHTVSPATTMDVSAAFGRTGSLILPKGSALPNDFQFQRLIETIGPGGNIPLDRTQNVYRVAARVRHVRGNHSVSAGFEFNRKQINGSESNDNRGVFQFRRDFGRDMIGNLLAGTPSAYHRAIGETHRGYRATTPVAYGSDSWKATKRLTLHLGLRYEPTPRPSEVNRLSIIPYSCDCNNLAPSFAFAYRPGRSLGVLRGAYSIQYGEIFSVTYMQTRYNAPGVQSVNVPAPDLVNPLKGYSLSQNAETRTDLFKIDPRLVVPYSHEYNLSWEFRTTKGWLLDLGYVGSRSHKLLSAWYTNRARLVPGIEPTTQNLNERRPDSRYTDVYYTFNASRAYYDAAKVTLRVPRLGGLNVETSYWLSKSIDIGADYTNTAFGRDVRQNRAPSEFGVNARMKGLSNFDQPHAFMLNAIYSAPKRGPMGKGGKLFGSWQLAAVMLAKTGTPFNIDTGSDAPGFGNADGVLDDRPNLLDPRVLGAHVDHPDKSVAQLPASAFSFPTLQQITGNLGRNTFRKDGIANVNASLSRSFQLGNSDKTMYLRAEALNFTNHPQFEVPGNRLSEGNFGQITNTLNDGRAFRLLLRLTF